MARSGGGPSGRAVGSAVGAVLGLVYVLVNARATGPPWSVVLALASIAGFAACLAAFAQGVHHPAARPRWSSHVGRWYWLVVAAEAALIFAGRYVLLGPLNLPRATLPWVTLVVGTHFFALAVVLRAPIQRLLGVAMTGCGIAGLGLAFARTSPSAVALIAGVCPGFLLLGFSLRGLLEPHPDVTAADVPSGARAREAARHPPHRVG